MKNAKAWNMSWHIAILSVLSVDSFASADEVINQKALPTLPEKARLAFSEDWATGRIDPAKWYTLHKKWGAGNNGVTPKSVSIQRDIIQGQEQNVLVCKANGDQYHGSITGAAGEKTRVGGVVVTKAFFASGRYEVKMKVGTTQQDETGPVPPTKPIGAVPAIWTYAYRWVEVPKAEKLNFVSQIPLYNPLMRSGNESACEYWSEIDFPELGKKGDFMHGLYNTFCQNRYDWQTFPLPNIADGQYHTYTMEWRTVLKPLANIKDEQVKEYQSFWWVRDKMIPFENYSGNPLKRLGEDVYAVYWGQKVEHWVDGIKVGQNERNVPAMAAQLTLGIWLPVWGGPAPWQSSQVSFGAIKIWQYDDPGDVRGVLTEDVPPNF